MAKKDKKDDKSTDKKSDKKSAKKSDKAREKELEKSRAKVHDKGKDKKDKDRKKGDKSRDLDSLTDVVEKSVQRTVESLVEKTIGNVVENAVKNIMKNARQGMYIPDDDEFETDPAVGASSERVELVLSPGDTIWALSQRKYGEAHVEAVYEANNVIPEVVTVEGVVELRDPVFNAGDKLVLPGSDELKKLAGSYKEKLKNLREEHRDMVGKPDESTEIRLVYGDTLYALAFQKYSKSVPSEALFEANNLAPRFHNQDGKRSAKEPIYFAGKKYRLPEEDEIDTLARRYREKHGIDGFDE